MYIYETVQQELKQHTSILKFTWKDNKTFKKFSWNKTAKRISEWAAFHNISNSVEWQVEGWFLTGRKLEETIRRPKWDEPKPFYPDHAHFW
jgi:hypothetical protein